jgi:hypothetical protein
MKSHQRKLVDISIPTFALGRLGLNNPPPAGGGIQRNSSLFL